jgi:EAL domain-containing protein (putative c-di-GMP-specific phosphodiesterase class I)/DNA-binding response OmpR family regulator
VVVIDPVLVVDDEASARVLVALALRRAGMEVIEAASGAEALEILETRTVSVVACDLGMPGMSGLDVVRALRSRPATATLPFILLTGSGDTDTVIRALDAGADDFLAKPIRLDELVARVRAHLRTQSAWSDVLEQELRNRASVVAALGKLHVSSAPDEAARVAVKELAQRTGSPYIAVLQLSGRGGLQPLASFDRATGLGSPGPALSASRAREFVVRAREGPWVQRAPGDVERDPSSAFWTAQLDFFAGAPIYSADTMVGLLILGAVDEPTDLQPRYREGRLLGAVTDFASVLSATAGAAIADRQQAASDHARLKRVLTGRQFEFVYQPIVVLGTRRPIGYEALTRFADGTAPDVRFAEAATAGLGVDFELAAIEGAIRGASSLPEGALLAVNVSPSVVLSSVQRLARIIAEPTRPLVLELTEHIAISDYAQLRKAIAGLGTLDIAVDDAGAGYNSLLHLLELRPAFAKIDIGLVRGIDTDPLRQAMAAGLAFYALRTGCRLIAEGVETEEEATTLAAIGVEYAQGYLFGRPEPLTR